MINPIRQVIIYKGHEKHPLFGPYPDNIPKRVAMFEYLNRYRAQPWTVRTVAGEHLVDVLNTYNPKETLLVIPAGQSTRLDKVFSTHQIEYIKNFHQSGGRGYFNCGSAYLVSLMRMFKGKCEEQPAQINWMIKSSKLTLFHGIAIGPYCPFPGNKYQPGFFSDAVEATDGKNTCTFYLSGGGGFILPHKSSNGQKVKVLVRYPHSELLRLGKKWENLSRWENAAIMVSVGSGAALLSMFHPYQDPVDVERYTRAFPDCGTNWARVSEKLSPLEARMRFAYTSMISKLEIMEFN